MVVVSYLCWPCLGALLLSGGGGWVTGIKVFFDVSDRAGYLFAPTAAWVTVATCLQVRFVVDVQYVLYALGFFFSLSLRAVTLLGRSHRCHVASCHVN